MIYQNFEDFARALPPGRPIIGIDLGTRTIGVAMSDVERRIATPHFTIRRQDQKKDLGRLWQIAAERNVCGIVLGMPFNMDGSDGPRTQSTRAFARTLEMYMPRPLTFWDERLSTVFAERALLEADTSRAKRELVIDKVAAAIILQGALDRIDFIFGGLARRSAQNEAEAPVRRPPPEVAPEAASEDAPAPKAGRARDGRALPRAAAAEGNPPPADAAPRRDADTVRRRRMMTRRIGPDDEA